MKHKNCCFLLFMSLLIAGCATMQTRWEKTIHANTIEAYEDFLRRYPNSKYNESTHLKWFREGVKTDKTSPGSLFIIGNGYSFNGEWGDELIEVINSSGRTSIKPINIMSIYKDRFGKTRVRLKEGKDYDAIVGDIKIRTNKGGLIINANDLIFFHTGITESADKIHEFEIIEKQTIKLTEKKFIKKKKKAYDKIIRGHIFADYWKGKVLTLSNPIYPQTIDDPTEPIEFSFDFLRHSNIDDKEVIVFWTRSEHRMGDYVQITEVEYYDHTPISIQKGEIKTIKINLSLVQTDPLYRTRSPLIEGRGYLVVYVVPERLLDFENRNYLIKTIEIENTISNVLRLPLEIRKKS